MRRTPGGRKSRFHALARAASWHRRKLAVVAAMAAVLTGVNAALPPDPPTVTVLRATTQLPGGAVLSAGDVSRARVPADTAPEGAIEEMTSAVGQTLTAPVARGQMITALDLVPARRNVRPGHVVAPLRLADADLAALLQVGDAVDVVAADTEAPAAAVVAKAVRVVALPRPEESSSVGGGGGSSGLSGALVLVEVDSKTATSLAQAAVTATLSVVLR
ncbi:MAG: SAF domain-containing protein [Propionibacteriaceae bacterium]